MNFSFIYGSYIAFFALAALPILIHLFARKQAKKIEFSSIIFIKESLRQKTKKMKFKNWLLLLIRTLIITCIIAAALRPVIKGNMQGSKSNSQSSVAIILDVSFSMGYEENHNSTMDAGKEAAKSIIKASNKGDEFSLLFMSKDTVIPFKSPISDIDVLSNEIDKAALQYTGADLHVAYKEALSILSSSKNTNREIYIISDMQKATFTRFFNESYSNEGIQTYYCNVRKSGCSNVAVRSFKFVPDLSDLSKPVVLETEIENYSNFNAIDGISKLFIGDDLYLQKGFDILPWSISNEKYQIKTNNNQQYSGYLNISDRGIVEDNKVYFSFNIASSVNCLLVSGSLDNKDAPGSADFIKNALIPKDAADSFINLEVATKNEASRVLFDTYDVIILDNMDKLSGSLISKINNYLKSGGGIVNLPGVNTDLTALNQQVLKKFIPGRADILSQEFDAESENQHYLITDIDYSHPVFSIFSENKAIERTKLFKVIKVHLEKKSEQIVVPAKLSSGDGLVVESKIGKGKFLLLTTAIDPKWNDLHFSPHFPPFLYRIILYLSRDLFVSEQAFSAGDALRYRIPDEVNTRNLIFTSSEGLEIAPVIESEGNISYASIPRVSKPGIYTLKENDRIIASIPVNANSSESDISKLSDEQFEQLREKHNIDILDTNGNISQAIMLNRFGRELWEYFIWAALILLIVEIILVKGIIWVSFRAGK